MSITVLTSITGGKDSLQEHTLETQAKFVAFTDEQKKSKTWEIRPAYKNFSDPRRNSRIHKILSHKYTDSEYSIWLDGNIRLLQPPEFLIEKYLQDVDLAVFKHPNRNCIYEEAKKCAVKGLDDPEIIIEQAKNYEDSGYAKDKGLCECGIIFRRHTDKVKEFNNAWWAEYCRFSRRDQISFMYAVDLVGLPIRVIYSPFLIRANDTAVRQDGSAEIEYHKHPL